MGQFVIENYGKKTWDQTIMEIAAVVAHRATCPRASVGAVLVRDTVPISWGYNGAARSSPHCRDVGCDIQVVDGRESCQRAVHAEMNAIINAARQGASTVGCTLVCTHAPCRRCADAIIQSGISRVVYGVDYGQDAIARLTAKGIEVLKVPHE